MRDKTDRQISLADGRMLGYNEYGDPDGKPVFLWHGEADWSIPVMMGRYVAEKIPYCQSTFYENEGHISLIKKYRDEIINALMA